MEFEFWESSPGQSPVGDIIINLKQRDPESAAKLWKKLKYFSLYGPNELRKSHFLEKLKGRNPYGLQELRIDLKDKICRFICITHKTKLVFLHFVIKKTDGLASKDIEVATKRAKIFRESK